MQQNRLKIIILVTCGLLIGLGIGILIDRYFFSLNYQRATILQLRESKYNPTYTYINPLLGCSITNNKESVEIKALRKKIQATIDKQTQNGKVSSISVYFDNRSGNSLNINPDEQFHPASMMKVPLMMAYLHLAETDPSILSKKVLYKGSEGLNSMQYYKPAITMQPGTVYTTEELLERMISYSDNNAIQPLIDSIDQQKLFQTYTDLGISIPAGSTRDYMTATEYSVIIRILYNATYLSWDMSEKAMKMMSEHNFAPGIKGGIPTSTLAAEKFGEIYFTPPGQSTGQKELHNCGVVYYPDHPYLLCIMTKGNDTPTLATSISAISAEVYEFFDQQFKQP